MGVSGQIAHLLHPWNEVTLKCVFPTEFSSRIKLIGFSSLQWNCDLKTKSWLSVFPSCIPMPHLCFVQSPPGYPACTVIPASGSASGGTRTKTDHRSVRLQSSACFSHPPPCFLELVLDLNISGSHENATTSGRGDSPWRVDLLLPLWLLICPHREEPDSPEIETTGHCS